MDERGKIAFHNVTIASDQGDVVEIGAGVSAGQEVALNIGDQIADGDRVAPSRAKPVVAESPPPKQHPIGVLTTSAQSP